ncbi:MAG TPA: hypothetical protein VII45_00835 [Solirubrobacterales bacterium]
MILDGRLDSLDPVRGMRTSPLLLAAADEVFVLAAIAFGFGVDQATTALTAVDTAAQVVEVSPRAFTADSLGLQQVLHFLKGRLIDQRLMTAVVDLASVGDNAGVVAVSQHELYVVGLKRPASYPTRRT